MEDTTRLVHSEVETETCFAALRSSDDLMLSSPEPVSEEAVANTPSPKAEAPSEVAFLIPEENHADIGAVTPEKAPLITSNLEAPKRPQSAYFLYCNDERELVILACRAKHPEGKLSMADVAKELGQRWKQASDEVRKKYESVAAEQKAQYQKLLHEFSAQTGGKSLPPRRKSATVQNRKPETEVEVVEEPPEPPKRTKSAYMLFCDEERDGVIAAHRAERPEQKIVMSDVAKELGQRWSNVSPDAKQKYEILAAQSKEQQQIEMREYIERFGRKPQKRKLFKIASPNEPKDSPRIAKRRTLTTLDVDATVLAEAQQLSLEGQFMEFACSTVVLENGIVAKKAASARFLLKILKGAGGLIEEAKTKLQKKLQSARK